MKTLRAALVVALALMGTVVSAPAGAQAIVSDNVRTFAVLPEGVRLPEGITANPANGDIYVGTFDFGSPNKLLRYDGRGRLIGSLEFGGTPLLGLQFGPKDGKVYIANFGASKIQRVKADFTGPIEDVATIPGIGAPASRTVGNPDGSTDTIIFGSVGFPAPNGLAFDAAGNLYVSDSFQGAIFRIASAHACAPCTPDLVKHDSLLATAGFPPFGANGVAFSADGKVLFIANTGDDRVLKLTMATGAIDVFAESVNGADGLAMDVQGLLWVAANQADTLVALDERGRVVAQVGSFEGVRQGRPVGFLFPASMVIIGREFFVTNLALALTPAIGDEPEEDVTRWTISRVLLPPLR
ncbi:MAG: SMP-30/gluconolactonase/LRE family protein [Burkholderiaceae bacterium]